MSVVGRLTGTEATVLLVLAAVVEPVRNPDLRRLGPALEAPSRRKLQELGLLEVEAGPRRSLLLSLTDKGWATAEDLLAAPPAGATGHQRALWTVAAGLGRYLRRESLALGEVVVPPDTTAISTAAAGAPAPPADPGPATVEQVRRAYLRIAAPGSWVALKDLRAQLPGVPAGAVDDALRTLYPEPGVHIVAEDNLKALTAEDRAAALQLGGRPLHAIRITR
ncbi:hypothetical protein GCM10027289_11570 [Tsukamurella serpentis]